MLARTPASGAVLPPFTALHPTHIGCRDKTPIFSSAAAHVIGDARRPDAHARRHSRRHVGFFAQPLVFLFAHHAAISIPLLVAA